MKHTRKNKKRRARRGSKAFDPSCRNHGQCDWCRSNRLHKFKVSEPVEAK